MLKVLYDAANEAMDSTENTGASNDLFDDEEDEATLTGMSFNHNHSFASLDVNNNPSQSTLTWATLMSKMKAEIKDVEYPQVPTLTSTRKLDLNQKFSLVPECFDPTTSKRRSLLIGCNYTHINGAQLKASHDDVRSMKVRAAKVSFLTFIYSMRVSSTLSLYLRFRTTLSTSMAFPSLMR